MKRIEDLARITEHQKRTLIMLCGALGFFDKGCGTDQFGDWITSKQTEELMQKIATDISTLILRLNMSPAVADRLQKAVKNGEYIVQCVRTDEQRKLSKQYLRNKIHVPKESVYDIAEEAMNTCVNCTRNKKVCRLRKALKNCEIPTPDGDRPNGSCEYLVVK